MALFTLGVISVGIYLFIKSFLSKAWAEDLPIRLDKTLIQTKKLVLSIGLIWSYFNILLALLSISQLINRPIHTSIFDKICPYCVLGRGFWDTNDNYLIGIKKFHTTQDATSIRTKGNWNRGNTDHCYIYNVAHLAFWNIWNETSDIQGGIFTTAVASSATGNRLWSFINLFGGT